MRGRCERCSTATATAPPAELWRVLAGVRGLLLDLDGVVVMRGEALPGSVEALEALDRRGLPYRVVTNTSAMSRATLAGFGRKVGLHVPPGHIISALSATAAWTRRHYPDQALFVMATDDARTEFDGQHVLTREEMLGGAGAAAVVVGDNEADLTYDVLNAAFRRIRDGAALIAMHRNQWWVAADGPRIDSGSVVAALEFATGARATVLGKPAAAFFREGIAALAADLGVRRLPASAVAMVGDDVRSDVLAAQRVGLRGVLVLSGKHGPADVEAAARERRGARPDAIAGSLAEVVAALS